MTFAPEAYAWLAHALGAIPSSLDLTRLQGATSSSLFLVQFMRGGEAQRFVLRVLDNPAWLANEPDLAAHEAAALKEAQKAGLAAPRLVAYAADDVGFGAPAVLMSFMEGRIDLTPVNFQAWLAGLARALASIHGHPGHGFAWRFRSWVNRPLLAPPAWTTIPCAWERAIERVCGPEPAAPLVFIHRDYHPTNVLWQDGAVSGVVDWINACQGPAGVDVAHCRTNVAVMYGPAAADQFLAAYAKADPGFVYDPYWDLDSLLDTCLPTPLFYPPWQVFGLDFLAPAVLASRVDAYLESVMQHRERPR